ncbi:ATP-dependent RecD-like DNA helicase [Candidatus Latescibacterota bacterium]
MPKENIETLKGLVKIITYHNEENGYVVAKIIPDGGRDTDINTVTGNVNMLSVGETVEFNGYWVMDKKYGRQFRFESYESVIPATLEGIKRFLASKYLKGIGPKLAERIVEEFGKDTIKVLDESPERLKEVKGLTAKLRASIQNGWASHRLIRDIMIFLQSYDISAAYASRIYDTYGSETIDKVRKNPYRLIKDIKGVGFIKADEVATKLGIKKDAPDRIRAGVLYCLDCTVDNGNVYSPLTPLVESAAETLDIESSIILETVESLSKSGAIYADEERVYRADLYLCEDQLSKRLKLIAATPLQGKLPGEKEIEAMVAEIEGKQHMSLAPLQRKALTEAARSNMLVLTGGPGTGKTTTVLGIIEMFKSMKKTVMLCAPTGRAAKRLSETTGMEAKTIHRLLEYDPHRGRFAKNEGDPLGTHVVIVDEVSMVDTVLMNDFLAAVSPYTVVIIVGDVDQLPSIGPGNVLRDIIDSGEVPTIRLTEIFRQAQSSRIVKSAHMINSGKIPYTDNENSGNFFFVRDSEPSKITNKIVDMVARRLPERYGFDPVNDIQILSPMHKSETGVANLNRLLQERLNPFNSMLPEVRKGDWVFRRGDKVMQIRNNYDKLVYNGDIGRIIDIDTKGEVLTARFDITVEYSFSELDELVPAYAISVHKSQGSEFKCVIIPVTTQHFIMLKRNLLYTAVTRARDLAVLVGDTKALAIAVNNDQVSERYTSLKEKLIDDPSLGGE